ncbi:MAG: FMN-binding protein [Planctomycetota bacterium]
MKLFRNMRSGIGELSQGVLVLAAICLVSGLGVGVLYVRMKDRIEAKQRQVFRSTLAEVLGPAETYPTVGEANPQDAEEGVYMRRTDGGALYATMGSAQGYQSRIKVLVSVEAEDPEQPAAEDPVIHRLAVVSSQETPGLGENVNAVAPDVSIWGAFTAQTKGNKRPWFQEQFSGRRLSDLEVVKAEQTEKIEAVTGATITSRATTKAAREAVNKIIEKTRRVYGR